MRGRDLDAAERDHIDRKAISNGWRIVKPMQDLRVRPEARLLKERRPERFKHCTVLDGHGEIDVGTGAVERESVKVIHQDIARRRTRISRAVAPTTKYRRFVSRATRSLTVSRTRFPSGNGALR